MNVYDTANRLAQELKNSEEYVNYKMAKETLNLNTELKKKIQEFEEARYDAQITAMQTGKNDEEKTKKRKRIGSGSGVDTFHRSNVQSSGCYQY